MREAIYEVERITDLKDMINKSVDKFADRNNIYTIEKWYW